MSWRMKVVFVLLLAGGLVLATGAGFAGQVSSPGGVLAAGNSGCYTVAGIITETGDGISFSGTVSGDLEGTSQTTLDPDIRVTGAASHISGERTIYITGGNVPELIGMSLQLTFQGVVVADTPPVLRINDRVRVVAGAEKGNFTEHGSLVVSAFPLVAELDYHGVVCP